MIYYGHELYHHGIKGQRWGIRRYQNEDGSLTPAGRKHYESIDSKRAIKEINKYIKKERAKQYGSSNKWGTDPIGKNSKQIKEKQKIAQKELERDSRHKEFIKKLDKIYEKSDNPELEEAKLRKEYKDVLDKRKEITGHWYGFGISATAGKEYVNGIGKEITKAYVKDLGFNDDAADYITKKITSGQRSL